MKNLLYAGFDLGTTFFKVGIYNENGRCIGLGRRSFVKDIDNRGCCTVSVERFRNTVSAAFSDAIVEAGCIPADISGVSYCSQANTFLLLDKNDLPLTPLIVWPDQRAAPMRNAISEMVTSETFLARSGQGIAAAESMLSKLDWFRFNEPELMRRVARILTISDYFVLLMTGCFIGDSGTASLTGLWNLQENMWNREILDFLDIDKCMLPELYRPGSSTVGVGVRGTEWLGIPENTPFTIGALDHHTAAIGGGINLFAPVSVSFGTSLVCFCFADRYLPAKQICIGPATDPDRYYQISFIAPGASAMDWYHNKFASDLSFEELFQQAGNIESGCGGVRAEINDGVISLQNKSSCHGHGHCARAVMELTGRNTAILLKGLCCGQDSPVNRIIAVGGAARSKTWMRVVEETTQISVIPACPADTASKGAAMFSAVSTGQYADLEECASQWIPAETGIVHQNQQNDG